VSVIDYSEHLLRGMDGLERRPAFVGGPQRNISRTPYLGLQPDMAASGEDGILVKSVRPESPAAAAGIQTGDLVVKIGDEKVLGSQTLFEVLGAQKAGAQIRITVKRGEETKELEATLGEPRRGN
jgi:S1-C subfamily serine protease